LFPSIEIALSDSISIIEGNYLSVSKNLTESLLVTEAFSRVALYSRQFSDIIPLTEAIIEGIGTTLPLTDSISISESQVLRTSKSLADSIAIALGATTLLVRIEVSSEQQVLRNIIDEADNLVSIDEINRFYGIENNYDRLLEGSEIQVLRSVVED
jgi:hypothetical protein